MDFLYSLINGLSLASIFLLAGLGLSLTFGMMKVINFAHGEFMMIGAYMSYVVSKAVGSEVSFFMEILILLMAFVVSGAFGFLLEKIFIKYLYGKPEYSILATMGLSLVLQQLARNIFGANNVDVATPAFLSKAIDMGILEISSPRIFILALSSIVTLALYLFIRKSTKGRQIQATIQDRSMAGCMGINTQQADAFTFALGSGIAGIAGGCLSLIGSIGPMVGQGYIISAFLVVIIGGVGSIKGTILGALLLGLLNTFLEYFTSSSVGQALMMVAVIVLLQVKPKGLFVLQSRNLD